MKRLRARQMMVPLLVMGLVVLLAAAFAGYTVVVRTSGTAPPSVLSSTYMYTRWTISPILTPPNSSVPNLNSVAATSVTDAWAVGEYLLNGAPQALIEHFNGCTWSLASSPGSNNALYGVAALAPNNAWAVGTGSLGTTLIEHWNGVAWSVITSPNPGTEGGDLLGIASSAANDIWAVGSYSFNSLNDTGQLIEHWNGTSWSIVTGPDVAGTNVRLTNVVVGAANDVWILGSGASTGSGYFVEHWNGSVWTVNVFGPDPTSGSFPDLDGLAANASGAWAAGSIYDPTTLENVPLVEHWNGTSWSVIPSAVAGNIGDGFAAIAVDGSGNAWAVGSSFLNNNNSHTTHTLVERSIGGGSFAIVPDATEASQYGSLSAVTTGSGTFAVGTTGPVGALGSALAEENSLSAICGAVP